MFSIVMCHCNFFMEKNVLDNLQMDQQCLASCGQNMFHSYPHASIS